jgi:hypothetical protein
MAIGVDVARSGHNAKDWFAADFGHALAFRLSLAGLMIPWLNRNP